VLTLRVAVRAGQQLARCAFDISELVPKSGCSIIGPEHFAMGDWTLTASIEAEVPGVPERAELDLGADEDEAALYGTPPAFAAHPRGPTRSRAPPLLTADSEDDEKPQPEPEPEPEWADYPDSEADLWEGSDLALSVEDVPPPDAPPPG